MAARVRVHTSPIGSDKLDSVDLLQPKTDRNLAGPAAFPTHKSHPSNSMFPDMLVGRRPSCRGMTEQRSG